MPRYNVQRPSDGYWACFSSISDNFVTDFMPREQYQLWRERQYGIHCGEIEDANIMPYDEAIGTILCGIVGDKYEDDHDGENRLDNIRWGECICDSCEYWDSHAEEYDVVAHAAELLAWRQKNGEIE